MTPSEKRHFRLAQAPGRGTDRDAGPDNRYMQLFDVLEGQSSFDDAAAMRAIGLRSRARHARIKNYLYRVILQSLEDYYRDQSVDAQFHHLINQIEILMGKRLYKQAGKALRKAAKLAEEKGIGLYEVLVERLDIERLVQSESFRQLEAHFEAYEQRKEYLVRKSEDYLDLVMIKGKIIWLLRYDGAEPSERHREWLDELSRHDMLNKIKYPEDVEFLLYYYNLNGLVSGLLGRDEDDYRFSKAYLDTYQANPDYIRRWPGNYITALGNVASQAANTEDWDELFDCTGEMREFLSTYNIRNRSNLESVAQVRSWALEAGAWRALDPEKRESVRKQVERCYRRHAGTTTLVWRMIMGFGIAHFRFLRGDWEGAIDMLNPIVQDPDDKIYAELQAAARILHLLAHLELGNDRFVEHQLATVRAWLRKRKLGCRAATIMLREVGRQLRLEPDTDRAEGWRERAQKIGEALGDEGAEWMQRQIDFESWLATKAEGIRVRR